MKILIIGRSGTGKSNIGDIIRSAIFKVDKDARIETDDPSRCVKVLGNGNRNYNIDVRQISKDSDWHKFVTNEDIGSYDIIVGISNNNFYDWFRNVYNR